MIVMGYLDVKTPKRKTSKKENEKRSLSLSLIKLASQCSRLPQQLLVLMLLYLRAPPSLGADGVHCAIVTESLDIRGWSAAGDIDVRLVRRGGTGGIHILRSDKGGGVGLVRLATGGVGRLVDCQNSRVARALLGRCRRGRRILRLACVGSTDDILGFVKRHRWRGWMERTQTLGELFDGELNIGHVHRVVRLHIHLDLVLGQIILLG